MIVNGNGNPEPDEIEKDCGRDGAGPERIVELGQNVNRWDRTRLAVLPEMRADLWNVKQVPIRGPGGIGLAIDFQPSSIAIDMDSPEAVGLLAEERRVSGGVDQ